MKIRYQSILFTWPTQMTKHYPLIYISSLHGKMIRTSYYSTHIRILEYTIYDEYYIDYLPNHNEFYAFYNFPRTGSDEKDHYRMPRWLIMA